MKAGLIVLAVLCIIIGGGLIIGVVSYVSAANSGNEFEQSIDAKYRDNQNVLGQYSLKIKEAAHVSDKYSQALSDAMAKALDARYGDDGSKAMFQMIKEQNPNLDPSIYVKLQQIIESGRNEFKVSQTTLLDQCRIYKTQSGYLWTGLWLRLAGYPKEGLEKKCTIVQSDYSKKAFETGVETGVDF
jgi:hypothetical protein